LVFENGNFKRDQVATNEKTSNMEHSKKSNVKACKHVTSCKHDFQKFYKSVKALNLLFSTFKHVYDEFSLGYNLKIKKEKKIIFLKVLRVAC